MPNLVRIVVMKLEKSSSTAKTNVVQNSRSKGSKPSTQLKKGTKATSGGRIPIRMCEDRKKVCRQIVASKKKSKQAEIKLGKTKKLDEKKITKTGKTKKQDGKKSTKTSKAKKEDIKKSNKTRKTKESNDKCKAYFTVEVSEKDLRSMLKNFSDKIILNMPGMKQERIREIECKIAGYETKKMKILKIVSQPGEKNAEISRTANSLQEIQKKITENTKETSAREKRKKSPVKVPSIEREQIKRKKPPNPITEDIFKNVSAEPIIENENKSNEDPGDFIPLDFPINIRASVNVPLDQFLHQEFSMEISQSSTMNPDSPEQPLASNPFSGDSQIKGSNDAAAYQHLSFYQFPSVTFLNDTHPSENYSRPVAKNQSPAFQKVTSKAFSSNMAANNMLPAVECTLSTNEPTTWPSSNQMHLNKFKEDAINNLAPVFEQQTSAYVPFSRNVTTNGNGKIRTHNESLTECASSLQQFDIESFPKMIPIDQSLYQAFVKTSKPSSPLNQDLHVQSFPLNSFSSDAQIKGSADVPSYQQTSASQQFPSATFLNDTNPSENYNRQRAKNQSSAVQQVRSTDSSSNMEAINMLPAVKITSSSKASTTKMHLNGFREDSRSNLVPAFEQQSSAFAQFSGNAITNAIGKIKTHNETLAECSTSLQYNESQVECSSSSQHNESLSKSSPSLQHIESLAECSSALQQSTNVLFSNVVPLNANNATETNSEIINIRNKSFNEMCSNQKSSVKRLEDQSFIKDSIAGNENLLMSHVTVMDDTKHLESDEETINFGLNSDLSNIRSKGLQNIGEKKIEAVKDNKQNVPPLLDLSINNCSSKNNPGNLNVKVNFSASRIQHDNCNAENRDCNKNQYNFRFSTPIYNYVDFIRSGSETAASPDTNSNISAVPMDQCIISNSSSSLTHDVLKVHLASCGLPEPFGLEQPRLPKDFINMENRTRTPTYGSGTPENNLLSLSQEYKSSVSSNDSNTTMDTISEFFSSQRSSSDSCLVTSSSTDDEYENVEHPSSFDGDALRLAASDSDICEEYSTNAVDEDLEQTESKFSLESILSPTSISFNNEQSIDGDNTSSSETVRPQRKIEIKPFENGSLYWLKKQRCVQNSDCESRETIPTRNLGSRNYNYYSSMINYLTPSRSHGKGRSENKDESRSRGISKLENIHLQELSSVQQNDKKSSKKITVTPKIEASQFNNKIQLQQLSTNEILTQVGLNVLAHGWSSPKSTYLENILTICGYKTSAPDV